MMQNTFIPYQLESSNVDFISNRVAHNNTLAEKINSYNNNFSIYNNDLEKIKIQNLEKTFSQNYINKNKSIINSQNNFSDISNFDDKLYLKIKDNSKILNMQLNEKKINIDSNKNYDCSNINYYKLSNFNKNRRNMNIYKSNEKIQTNLHNLSLMRNRNNNFLELYNNYLNLNNKFKNNIKFCISDFKFKKILTKNIKFQPQENKFKESIKQNFKFKKSNINSLLVNKLFKNLINVGYINNNNLNQLKETYKIKKSIQNISLYDNINSKIDLTIKDYLLKNNENLKSIINVNNKKEYSFNDMLRKCVLKNIKTSDIKNFNKIYNIVDLNIFPYLLNNFNNNDTNTLIKKYNYENNNKNLNIYKYKIYNVYNRIKQSKLNLNITDKYLLSLLGKNEVLKSSFIINNSLNISKNKNLFNTFPNQLLLRENINNMNKQLFKLEYNKYNIKFCLDKILLKNNNNNMKLNILNEIKQINSFIKNNYKIKKIITNKSNFKKNSNNLSMNQIHNQILKNKYIKNNLNIISEKNYELNTNKYKLFNKPNNNINEFEKSKFAINYLNESHLIKNLQNNMSRININQNKINDVKNNYFKNKYIQLQNNNDIKNKYINVNKIENIGLNKNKNLIENQYNNSYNNLRDYRTRNDYFND